MKTNDSLPLVGHPENMARQWPNVASDHTLPLRHARTEATVSAAIMAVCGGAALVVLAAPLPFVWLLVFAVILMWLVMFLQRYEAHVPWCGNSSGGVGRPFNHGFHADRAGGPVVL